MWWWCDGFTCQFMTVKSSNMGEVKLTQKRRRKIFLIQVEWKKRKISEMDNIYVIIWIAIYTSMKVLGLLEKLLCTYSCCPITTSLVYRTSGLWSFSSTSSNGKVGKICSVLPPLYLLTLNFHVKFWLTIICVCEWFYILLAFCGGKVWYLFLLKTIYPIIMEGII